MKKFNVFLLIMLAFSCFFVFDSNTAFAENPYTIKIATTAIHDTEQTNLDKYTFYADYASNKIITFNASVYNGEQEATDINLTYSWYDVTNKENPILLSNTRSLTLDKSYAQSGTHLIYVGEKSYQVKVSGEGIEDFSVNLSVNISDTTNQIIVTNISKPLGVNQYGQYLITKNTDAFELNSFLCKPKVDTTINWFLKTPNSSSFTLLAEGPTCAIFPYNLVSSENGFGEYKIYAGAQSSSILFTSKMITFKASAGELNEALNYTISSKTIDNSKAEVEAFTFTLDGASAEGIDFNKIIWYVNNQKYANGESFTYEPTNNETFVVEAKYQGASLTPLASLETTPKSTGTLKMILIVAGAVCILSIIFGISVKTLNKRRDVTW